MKALIIMMMIITILAMAVYPVSDILANIYGDEAKAYEAISNKMYQILQNIFVKE